ncbi:BglG family transcription antiterminator [Brevibacillus laterosporus]|uniref:BglG family transcription antiterminator n=1 Tax=Brevibacillus laterosporus TaxID=1465 RepID=UPI0026566B76|nr:BglG family transcription antiterminator [Brevibacillus laterosporus]MDN9009926.1 BglG family transcription antiterminator [Brevibacillus laterosporus]MDO0940692.1 BglG family transcription antiterminator [Brevibacillus laterosporus]
MNARQIEILRILLTQSDQHVLVQEIAEKVGCSEKTIRNDFKRIQDYLREHSTATLIRKPGLGVFLEIEEHEKANLFHKLHMVNHPIKYESDEKMILEIAYQLVMNVKPVTVQELASKYFVNKAVIKKSLDKIEKWLNVWGLTLISKQKVGLMIEGNEKAKRTALARLSQLTNNSQLSDSFIKEQFSSHEVEIVKNELKQLQKRHSFFFTDETLEGLIVHVLLMIRRTKLKQPITLSEKERTLLQDKKEYEWTAEFLTSLESIFAVKFAEVEITYLALHILGGKIRYQQKNEEPLKIDDFTENNPVLAQLLSLLIARMSEFNMIDFMNDQALLDGLKVHLYTTLNRLTYGLPVSNPMLSDIKRMYPYMFDMVLCVLEEVYQSLSLSIPEEEAAYLVLHFQASIERFHSNREKTKNVVIVCHMGIGMSQLLRTKLERKFISIHIVACLAKADVKEYLANHDVDFVISTVSLPEVNIPYIVISPLLEAAEEKRLENFITQLNEPLQQTPKESVLLKFTTPFLVFLHQDAEHRYELIEMLATVLHEKGFVEKEYTHNAITRERMSSTNIGSGVAIPHGNPKLIRHSAIAIATLKEPIEWGSEKVSLVFMLAVKNDDQEDTRQLFRELSFISEQPAFIQTLIKETDNMQFLSHFHHSK